MPDRLKAAGADPIRQREPLLRALLDAIVPADDFPAASDAGGLDFLARMLEGRPDWAERLDHVLDLVARAAHMAEADFVEQDARERLAILDSLAGDPELGWLAQLVNAGYYADPANCGNRGAASWTMIGWRPEPPAGWPALPENDDRRALLAHDQIAERYDAIVVGSGAGGGVAACGLAESGRSVLVVEAGDWPDTAVLAADHIRNPRSNWGVDVLTGPPGIDNPRIFDADDGARIVRPWDGVWNNNASTSGGGTRVYGAQAWRFVPRDFAMATSYGVPEGSDLADWPFGYDELEPYYERAEWEIGVSGEPTDPLHGGLRHKPYPMPPLPAGASRDRLAVAARSLGFSTHAVPLAVNSLPFLGRPRCAQCSMCVGFACPVDAKNGSLNTMLARAFATGRCAMTIATRAARLLCDQSGHVIGVALVGECDGHVWRRDVMAGEVVLSAGAVETARLLLNSPSNRELNGIGNDRDQVGRRLQGHVYGGAIGIFDEVMEDLVGPGPSISTTDFRHGNPGLVGGGMLANEFVPLPANTYRYLADAGLIPLYGPAAKHGMRALARRMIRIMGPIQEVTSATSRVRVDPSVTDRFGIPVARLGGGVHEQDLRSRTFLSGKAAEWLRAAGARQVVEMGRGRPVGPSGGQHQAGTCRMGADPAHSVTDPFGRVWGHDNLRIADASLHVTNGGVNPVLTVYANAMRVIDHMVRGRTGRIDS